MRSFLATVVSVAALAAAIPAQGAEQLGKVSFPTSCDPKVQAQFERGVAMLHSYWFIQARKTFESVLQQDPNCAMAYWGIAVDLLGNSLVAPPPAKVAEQAWQALEKARAINAKTQRERDWIEALSAYFRDHDKVAVDARLAAFTKAMEQLAQRYPEDFEAWTYYALALQSSASKTDKTYSNQLKSAAILEKQIEQNPQHPGVAHYLIHAYDYPPLADKGLVWPRGAMRESRRRRRTRVICRRTFIRGSECGKNPSRRTCRRSKSSPTTTMRWISLRTPTFSSPKMRRPDR
jgi:tetratricopeptide (TPR) repeat protein